MINHANPIVDIQTNMVNAGCINTHQEHQVDFKHTPVFPDNEIMEP